MMKKFCYKTHCFTKVAHVLGPILKSENPNQKLLMSKCVIMVCARMYRSGLLNGRGTGPSRTTLWTVTVSLFTVKKLSAQQFQQDVISSVVIVPAPGGCGDS